MPIAERLISRRKAIGILLGSATTGCTGGIPKVADTDRGPPPLTGYSSQYRTLRPVRTARLTPFLTEDGRTIDLEHFRGKTVLVNFWATWCAPCVFEMPSLDRLQQRLGSPHFAVIPISIDRADVSLIRGFHAKHGLKHLRIYLDPDSRTGYRSFDNPNNAEFALYGLPISYLIDARGRIRGYLIGAADWQSREAERFIQHFIRSGDRDLADIKAAAADA